MSLLKNIKELIFFEKDKDFFDKEATIKEYFNICPPERRKKVESYEELYEEALKYVSKQSFEDNTKMMENYFEEVDGIDAAVAILTGIFAYKIACYVDEHGPEWENGKSIKKIKNEKIKKKLKWILGEYDVNNPFDRHIGKGHRDFGHDIFTFALKNIPNDFKIIVAYNGHQPIYQSIGTFLGKSGNVSMLDLIWHYYGKNAKTPLHGIFNCLGHTVVHFSKDLLTREGVPLPFSSLFNQYSLTCDNDFNRKVEKYNGAMKASDIVSLTFIEGMCKLYSQQKNLGDKEKSFNRDLKIMAMGTCIMIQMSNLILAQNNARANKEKGILGMIPGAKLNVIMTGALFKNMVQEMGVVVKARHEVNVEYNKQLKKIRSNPNE